VVGPGDAVHPGPRQARRASLEAHVRREGSHVVGGSPSAVLVNLGYGSQLRHRDWVNAQHTACTKQPSRHAVHTVCVSVDPPAAALL
jgi:hypothetical protein